MTSMPISLRRMFLASWKHLSRNAWLAAATIFVFTTALVSVNTLIGVQALFGRVTDILKSRMDMTIAFKPDTPEAVVNQARFYLVSLPQVFEVKIKTVAEVQADFRARHVNDPKILSALEELPASPLGAELVIKAKEAGDYAFLARAIQHPQYTPFIQAQTYDDHADAIARVQEVSDRAQLFGAILVFIFAFFSLLIAFNAIRVGIYAHRDEIGIMRLVGASSPFIRLPFIFEGMWLAVFSLLLSTGFMFVGVRYADPALRPLFDGFDPGLTQYFFQNGPSILFMESGVLLLLVLFISWLAVGRYIKR